MTNQLKNFTSQKKIFDITLFSYIYKTKFVTDSWFYAMEVVQARRLEDFEQNLNWYRKSKMILILRENGRGGFDGIGDRGWGLVGAVSEFKLTILSHSLDF